nr:DUF6128 domain-containing protein [uncultured Mediterraneibacter sp.]
MNPGTYYLYEYDTSKRRRNVGFIKVTRHYQSCILQLHAKGLPVGNGESLELSAFCHDQDTVLHTKIAALTCCRRAISARLSISERNFPQGRSLSGIDGFFVTLPREGYSLFWMASAGFFDITPEMLREPGTASPETSDTPVPEEVVPDGPPAPENQESSSPAGLSQPEEQEEVPPAEPPAPEEQEESSPAEAPASEAGLETSERKPAVQAKKIRRSDLTLLPRKFWPLANNSFLLHGYHNYNHLILLEDAGRLWLGVPGIYDPREARAADLFGFPRFTQEGAASLELSEEELCQTPGFGHWCRCIGPCSGTLPGN